MNAMMLMRRFALGTLLLSACSNAMAQGRIPDYIGADYTRDLGQGLLVTAAPYPNNRVDDPRRAQNGRLWVPRTPVGSRTPIRESVYGFPGPSAYGAPVGAIDDVIYVQTREPLPLVTVSPWVNLDEQNIRHLKRERPWLRRTGSVLADLRQAQVQYLTEQGYIQKVRTHVNPAHFARAVGGGEGHAAVSVKDIKPRAVIRVKERFTKPPEIEASAPAERPESRPAPVVRVSKPATAGAPIRVVRAD